VGSFCLSVCLSIYPPTYYMYSRKDVRYLSVVCCEVCVPRRRHDMTRDDTRRVRFQYCTFYDEWVYLETQRVVVAREQWLCSWLGR
jgi:hypothetical protein